MCIFLPRKEARRRRSYGQEWSTHSKLVYYVIDGKLLDSFEFKLAILISLLITISYHPSLMDPPARIYISFIILFK